MLKREASEIRVDYDAELQRHSHVLRQAWAIGPRDHVLDVGCGTGQTTREAARLADAGTVLGVDISLAMIEQAQAFAKTEGPRNVTFVHADAAVHPFPPQEFDIIISRYGTMFFETPVPAFANLARALRRGGRLAMLVWQAAERNEWAMSIREVLANAGSQPPSQLNAFSLGDPNTIERTLESAGFADITISDVNEPVYYGPDIAAALDWISGFSTTKTALQGITPENQERTLSAFREMLEAHRSERGVWFDSRAWLVLARRP
jgi:ubiquinone/menaquinone biosynthesis C-methylase UbiE